MRSEIQYERIIQDLLEPIYMCDAEGRIKIYNKAAAELWGREPIQGQDLYCASTEIFDRNGNKLPMEMHPMAITLNERRHLENAEVIIQRPDGTRRHILHSSVLIYNMHGNFDGAVSMLIDVTEKRKADTIEKLN